MPLVEYTCPLCKISKEEIVKYPFPVSIKCGTPDCEGEAIKGLSVFGTYKMTGNNGASITPKRFRGNRER